MKLSNFVRLFGVVAVATVVGCSDPTPLGVPEEQPQQGLLGGLLGNLGLVSCTPLPADSVTQTIGSAGGTIEVGPHMLYVPPNALDEPVAITAVTPSGTVNMVQFAPEGLTFDDDVYLTMSYSNCNLLGLLLPKRVAYVDDDLGILEYLLSVDHVLSQTVTGSLDHFSNYAVAW